MGATEKQGGTKAVILYATSAGTHGRRILCATASIAVKSLRNARTIQSNTAVSSVGIDGKKNSDARSARIAGYRSLPRIRDLPLTAAGYAEAQGR
jgi:hypothetical protein